MNFVVDENLPRLLARSLLAHGHQAWHSVDLLGFSAGDEAIWAEAIRRNAMVVTKDADFVQLLSRPPPHCPVVHVRIGNCPTPPVIDLLIANLDAIAAAVAGGTMLIHL